MRSTRNLLDRLTAPVREGYLPLDQMLHSPARDEVVLVAHLADSDVLLDRNDLARALSNRIGMLVILTAPIGEVETREVHLFDGGELKATRVMSARAFETALSRWSEGDQLHLC